MIGTHTPTQRGVAVARVVTAVDGNTVTWHWADDPATVLRCTVMDHRTWCEIAGAEVTP